MGKTHGLVCSSILGNDIVLPANARQQASKIKKGPAPQQPAGTGKGKGKGKQSAPSASLSLSPAQSPELPASLKVRASSRNLSMSRTSLTSFAGS